MRGHGALITSYGKIYYTVQGLWSDLYGWATRVSNDGGKTFETVDYFIFGSGPRAGANTIAEDSAGNILVGGYQELEDSKSQQIVVRKLAN